MEITRGSQAQAYDASGHFGMRALRLHGGPGSGLKDATVGLSHFEPGGGASLSASEADRVYVVLSGEITVTAGDQTEMLSTLDSCFIPAGQERVVENPSGAAVSMLVFTRTKR
jgi:quercetin dioxygenase-like cupin family protein